MPQLHLYVPEALANKIKQKARQSDLSTSKYLAELIKRDVVPGWPEDFFTEVVGGWQGETLERPSQGGLDKRDNLELTTENG